METIVEVDWIVSYEAFEFLLAALISAFLCFLFLFLSTSLLEKVEALGCTLSIKRLTTQPFVD